jgi:DNA topoisomerase-3
MSPKAYKLEKSIRELGNIICPKCKTGFVIKGNTAFGCSRYEQGCDFRLSKEKDGKEIELEELKNTLAIS